MNQKSESRSRFAKFLGTRLVLAGCGILLLLILSALPTAPRGWTRELFGPRISIRETIWVPAEGLGFGALTWCAGEWQRHPLLNSRSLKASAANPCVTHLVPFWRLSTATVLHPR